MNEPDDLFAPRPKLSWKARLIQAVALLAAIGISLGFTVVYAWIITSPHGTFVGTVGPVSRQEKLLWLVTFTVLHILLLIPCWRSCLLRRWACAAFAVLSLCGALFLFLSGEVLAFGPFMLTLFFAWMIADEWPDLKSGF